MKFNLKFGTKKPNFLTYYFILFFSLYNLTEVIFLSKRRKKSGKMLQSQDEETVRCFPEILKKKVYYTDTNINASTSVSHCES